MIQESKESGIIEKCRSGKLKHQELFYKHFYGFAMGICLRYAYTRMDAMEMLNDSFLKVFNSLHKFDERFSFKAWFRKIITNTAIDYYRKNARLQPTLEIEEAENETFNINLVDTLTYEDIKKLLDNLPEVHRLIFNLYEIEGYTHHEIAKQLDVTESTSRSYLTRAKKKLRILVEKHFESEYERKIRT